MARPKSRKVEKRTRDVLVENMGERLAETMNAANWTRQMAGYNGL